MKSADKQASIFLHQKLKVCSSSTLPFLFPVPPSFLSSSLPPQVCVNANDASLRRWRAPEGPPASSTRLRARWGADDTSCVQQLSRSAPSQAATCTGPEERRKIVACMWYVICPLLSLPCTNTDDLIVDLPTARVLRPPEGSRLRGEEIAS
ncbi:hypothetical protein B0H13DRAFT_2394983 [Mycena leptocephala]|nr:hypothetical protein B0H13DRAFT_2394983 [Mycena leptocephala]